MSEDTVAIDRKSLLALLVKVESCLEEVKNLRREIKKL